MDNLHKSVFWQPDPIHFRRTSNPAESSAQAQHKGLQLIRTRLQKLLQPDLGSGQSQSIECGESLAKVALLSSK